jgi:hypothetical protein
MSNEDVPEREVIASLAEKLEAFAASLEDRERDVLTAALQSRDEALAEVSGFAAGTPIENALNFKAGSKTVPTGISTKLFPSIKYDGPVRIKTTEVSL